MTTKTEVDRARPGVLAALADAERCALPQLKAVDAEARAAIRVARDAVSGEVYPPPGEDEVQRALAAYSAAVSAEGTPRPIPSASWALERAVVAALLLASGGPESARREAGRVRAWVRELEQRAAATARERELFAYQEAWLALRRGEVPVRLSTGEGAELFEVELFGAHRGVGGVVVVGADPGTPTLATDWTASARVHPNPYMRELGGLVEREMVVAARPDQPRGYRVWVTLPAALVDLAEVRRRARREDAGNDGKNARLQAELDHVAARLTEVERELRDDAPARSR